LPKIEDKAATNS